MKGITKYSLEKYKLEESFSTQLKYQAFLEELKIANEKPIISTRWARSETQVVWVYKEFLYVVDPSTCPYNDEQIQLLIYDDYDKERRRFERLRSKFEKTEEEREESKRPRIPEEIRIKAWQRDGGKCARCGSREKLEYDHIVPISKGGSNTLRNIELLCEECNRSKGSKIS